VSKKAIVVASFGTTDVKAIEKSIESTENQFRDSFPEYDVFRAFTSTSVIEKLAQKSGILVDSVGESFKKLVSAGYEEVYVQPLYVVADKIYTHIKDYVIERMHSQDKEFKKMKVGRPLLSSTGLKNHPDDYKLAIEAVKTEMPELGSDKAVVFMCNGSNQLEYSVLQLKLADSGIKNAFVYTAEGYPSFEGVIRQLAEQKAKEVMLAPFVLTCGDHLLQYLAGDNADSVKAKLEAAGYTVSVYGKGLGENAAIQAIFVQHLKDGLLALERKHGHHRTSVHGQKSGDHHYHK